MNNASLELGGTNWAEKDGNILGYSVGDTSGKYFPQEFTFARGSNLSATRIGKTGLIEKGRENVLTYSNDFSNVVWVKSNASVTSGQSGYDGTNNAWLLKGNTSNLAHRVYNALINNNINTLSVYVKASGHNYIQILSGNSVNQYANFDLSDGSIGNSGSNFTPKIESIGNDWYRISAFNNLSLVYSYIQLVSSKTAVWNESWSMPNATDGVLIQDAQAELGLVASPYIETTTTTAQAGVLENTPRLNYTTGVANPYLLLEPSRTNLIQYSEYFEGSYWNTNSNALRSLSSNLSPDGTANAYRVEAVSGTQVGYVGVTTIGTTITHSVYVRRISGSTTFDMVDVNNVSTQVDITNDWKRFSVTASATSTNLRSYLRLNQIGDVVEIFGFQAEVGSYPTSYIPTYSVSATRAQDVCNKTNASGEIGQTEGTIFAEFDSPQFLSGSYIGISDGTTSNRQIFGFEGASGNSAALRLYGFWTFIYGTFASGEKIKVALAYKNNDFALYVNGTQAGTNSGATISGTLSQFGFNSGASAQNYQGNVYQTELYKERLTNAELATLTTI